MFLHASSNNRADTVLNLFTEAVATFGLPSHVRCDKGGENYDVGFTCLITPSEGQDEVASLQVISFLNTVMSKVVI